MPSEYEVLNDFFTRIASGVNTGEYTRDEINAVLRETFGPTSSPLTLQGFVATKPHGYPGDFEIIDKIYTRYCSNDPHFRRWDEYFHSQVAVEAVRNRKTYFVNLLSEDLVASGGGAVLSVASGPARDIAEFCATENKSDTLFECVDMDANAIEYATSICEDFLDRIIFHQRNIFRFNTDRQFDLVWCAGLFDYLDDSKFVFLLKKLFGFVAPGGLLVVGNFSDLNASRDYMEAGDWYLNHRSKADLLRLAEGLAAPMKDISVRSETLNVNLFLHLTKANAAE